jgi:hypothetical protein
MHAEAESVDEPAGFDRAPVPPSESLALDGV